MILNEFGKIAEQQWIWLAENFPYVRLYEFVIMPDHMHGIIEIDRRLVGKGRDVGTGCNVGTGRIVGTGRDLYLQYDVKIKSLSELMGAYKMTTSKKIHLAGYHAFIWQRSFYDRVIRNEIEYYKMAEYIVKNPLRAKEEFL